MKGLWQGHRALGGRGRPLQPPQGSSSSFPPWGSQGAEGTEMQQEAGGKGKERAAISSGTGVGGAVVSENGVDSEIHLQSEETASQGSEVSQAEASRSEHFLPFCDHRGECKAPVRTADSQLSPNWTPVLRPQTCPSRDATVPQLAEESRLGRPGRKCFRKCSHLHVWGSAVNHPRVTENNPHPPGALGLVLGKQAQSTGQGPGCPAPH